MELPDGSAAADDVYLIARVFGLGQERMGMKLYLDPWKLRRKKQLRFSANVYQVTPPLAVNGVGRGSGFPRAR